MAETLRIQDKPVAVEGPADQYTLRNLGPDTAYYGAANVSSSSNDGSIAAGSSVTVAPTKWLVSAGQSRVTVAAVAQGSSDSSGAPHPISAVVYGDARFPSSPTSVTENGVTTTFTYDAAGNVLTETRAGKTATYAYDGTGNLTGATVA